MSKDGSKTDNVITIRVNLDQLKPFLARLGVTIVEADTDNDDVFNADGTFKDPEADALMRDGFQAVGEMKATPRPLLEHWLNSDYRPHTTDPARHPFKIDKNEHISDDRRFGHVVIPRDTERLTELAEKLRDVMIIHAVHVYRDRYELWGLSPQFSEWISTETETPRYRTAFMGGSVVLTPIERPDLAAFIARPRVSEIDERGIPIDTVIPESNQIGRILITRALIAEPKFWQAIYNHAVIYGSHVDSAETIALMIKSPQLKPCTGSIPMYDCEVHEDGEVIFTLRA